MADREFESVCGLCQAGIPYGQTHVCEEYAELVHGVESKLRRERYALAYLQTTPVNMAAGLAKEAVEFADELIRLLDEVKDD
jgi:hypothetical protein